MASRREVTRTKLLAAALKLFAESGYENVSVGQIAARAGVTEMTFYRHFSAKAALLVDDPYDPVIGAEIRRQPAGLDPITRAARGIRSAWQGLPPPASDEVRVRLRIIARTPGLRAHLAAGTAATEAVITEALIATGTDADQAAIAAGAVLGALNTALLDWSVTDAELGQAITMALDVLEHRHG